MTMNVTELARRDLKMTDAYRPAPPGGEAKLDANESPWNLPEGVRKKLLRWLEDGENLNRYPDSDNSALREAAARHWAVEPGNVTCGVGSDQLIDMLCAVFLEPGDKVVTQKPTFGMYIVSARFHHGSCVSVPAGYDSGAADELLRAAERERAKIIFLCRPNNPTGRGMSEDGVRRLLDGARCVVVVDEAYGEFAGYSLIEWTRRYPRLVVLKTLSKAFGLAGARVGFAVADESVIQLLDVVKPPFNMPTISQMLAVWALEESGEFLARAGRLADSRDLLRESLAGLDWLEAEPSEANFIYIKSARDVAAILDAGGVSSRRFAKSGDMYCVRVSVGTDEENKKVSDLLWAANPK
jgi:histidinol-phosphate aminotransferase